VLAFASMENEIGKHIVLTSIALTSSLTRKLKEEGFGITDEQWKCLSCINQYESLKQTQISQIMLKPAPAVSKIVARLKKMGLVKERVGVDKRERFLFLAAKAKASIDQMDNVARATEQTAFRGISKSERIQLFESLSKIRTNLGVL